MSKRGLIYLGETETLDEKTRLCPSNSASASWSLFLRLNFIPLMLPLIYLNLSVLRLLIHS